MSTTDSAPIHITALYLYPIKSCRGQALETASLDARGLRYDRSFMIVDPEGKPITQREYPQLAQLQVMLDERTIQLTVPQLSPLHFVYRQHEPRVDVSVWGAYCVGIDQGDQAAEWLGKLLHTPCRLVRMADDWHRSRESYEQNSFADEYPLMLLSEASLADLNNRLETPVPMQRFRPNIVLSGATAYAEESWKRIRIGSTIFDLIEPCARCSMTTINPDTLEIGKEPLRTLAKYRRLPSGAVIFGQYAVHRKPGILHVGDTVEVLE